MPDTDPISTQTSFPEAETAESGIAQAASIVAFGNVASRVLGLLREMISASLFGATGLVSAFGVANTIPKQIFDLLIGGMLHSALVPVFSEYAALKRREDLWRVFSIVLSMTAISLLAITLLLEMLSSHLVRLIAGGFETREQAATLAMTRLMLPAVIFLSLAGVVTAFLYGRQRFFFPALGVAIYNAGIILSALLLSHRLDIYSLALGVLIAAILQLGVQLPGLRGVRIQFAIDFRHPALRRILTLYAPVVLGLVISLAQVAIDRRLASGTGPSSIAWMDKATTLVQSAHGFVAVAISTAVLPMLAQASARQDWQNYRDTLGQGLRLSFLLIVPLAVGLFLLAEPLIGLLFERGAFKAEDTFWTAWALRLYLLGLVFATIDWPLNYAFYARQDTLMPALVGVFSVGIYLMVSLLLLRPLRMLGLVLADSCKHFGHAAVMLVLAYFRLDAIRGQRLLATLAKIALASAVMGIIVWGLSWIVMGMIQHDGFGRRLLVIVLSGGVGGIVYAAAVGRMHVDEAWLLLATVKGWVKRLSGCSGWF